MHFSITIKAKLRWLCQFLLLLGVWIYRTFISPWMMNRCRFLPTCSEYSVDSIKEYGPYKGTVIAIKRICRCHPWGGHGLDLVSKRDLK